MDQRRSDLLPSILVIVRAARQVISRASQLAE
jgi:hypothetical protein